MQNSKSKMQSDNEKFKREFKERLYRFVLRLIKFVSSLPRNSVTVVIIPQILRGRNQYLGQLYRSASGKLKKGIHNIFSAFSKISKRDRGLVDAFTRY